MPEYKEPDINIMHYNRDKGLYKVLDATIMTREDRDASLLIRIKEGEKGNQDSRKSSAIALSKMELAFLIKEFEKLYNLL